MKLWTLSTYFINKSHKSVHEYQVSRQLCDAKPGIVLEIVDRTLFLLNNY